MFTVTHPFHPLYGKKFPLKTRRTNWGEDRVIYFNDAGRLRSMLVSWTDVAVIDCFMEASSGKSWFRVDDLLELDTLLQKLKSSIDKGVK